MNSNLKPLFKESLDITGLSEDGSCYVINKYLYLYDRQYNTYVSFGQILEDDDMITGVYMEEYNKDYQIFEFTTKKFKYKIYYKYSNYNILESVNIIKEEYDEKYEKEMIRQQMEKECLLEQEFIEMLSSKYRIK